MDFIISGLCFIYGAVFGSFFNVLIYRLPRDMSIAKGRSMCPNCGNTLKAKHLIPIFSWFILRGKCGFCGEKISCRYPIVEFMTGSLFLLSYLVFDLNLNFLYHIVFWSMLLVVSFIDFDFMYILDSVLISFGVILAVIGILLFRENFIWNLMAGVLCFCVYYTIYFITKKIYKKEAFGFGDVLLIFVVGFSLGWKYTYLSMFFPFIVASVYFIFALVLGKMYNLKQEVPFGPFICVSAFIISLYGQNIMNLLFLK